LIIQFQNILEEVRVRREYFDYHKKRELEKYLLIKLHNQQKERTGKIFINKTA
jgi:hypothetical protein